MISVLPAARAADCFAIQFRHQQPIRSGFGILFEPWLIVFFSHRLGIEGDACVDDVVIVDFCQPRQVAGCRWTNDE